MISIIIPVKNQLKYTKQILEDIPNKIKSEYEIIIINDNSSDGTDEWIKENFKGKYMNFQSDVGVNKAWNFGVDKSIGDYLLIINNDIVLTEGIDLELINGFDENTKIVCPVSTIGPNKWELPLRVNTDNIAGWCFMIKKEDWQPVDERLDIRYGDNRIYHIHNKKLKYIDGAVHHYESKTLKSPELKQQIQKRINKDKLMWQIILDENNWKG